MGPPKQFSTMHVPLGSISIYSLHIPFSAPVTVTVFTQVQTVAMIVGRALTEQITF